VSPVKIASDAVDIAFGTNYSIVLNDIGQVLMSGSNTFNQFGLTDAEEQIISMLESPKYDAKTKMSNAYINISILKQLTFKVTKVATMGLTSFFCTDSYVNVYRIIGLYW
jgi:alpha-tubulin suppressor-like RCC1 family protein